MEASSDRRDQQSYPRVPIQGASTNQLLKNGMSLRNCDSDCGGTHEVGEPVGYLPRKQTCSE
jgi:hypothetical protein